MRITAILADLLADIREVAQGTEAPHADLRHRLTAAIVVTVLVDAIATLLIFWVEKGHAQSDIHSLWDAFYFTTAQLVTVGASFSNPVTMAGQALCLLIDLYAITIVSTIAGMFGAFFYHRSVQKHGAPDHKPAAEDKG